MSFLNLNRLPYNVYSHIVLEVIQFLTLGESIYEI